jgi:hypothetical protein
MARSAGTSLDPLWYKVSNSPFNVPAVGNLINLKQVFLFANGSDGTDAAKVSLLPVFTVA